MITGKIGIRLLVSTVSGPVWLVRPLPLLALALVVSVYSTEDEECRFTVSAVVCGDSNDSAADTGSTRH